MHKKIYESMNAPAPIGPYSQAVEADGFVFCSGQVGLNPKSGQLADGLEAQTRQVMENIGAVLSEAKLSFHNVIKTTIFLTDMNDFQKVNEIYGSYFRENPPARSTFAVAGLPRGAKVEIEVLAKSFMKA